ISRVTGRPSSAEAKSPSHNVLVVSLLIPVSMIAQPAPSSTSQRLMWSSAKGSGMRSHLTPGATIRASPAAGGAAWGKRSAARPLSSGVTSAPSRVAHALEDRGDALADADAHGDQRVAPAAPMKLADGGEREPCARGAQRMADGDGAAIGIDPVIGEVDLEQLEAAEHLARKGLVELDHVDVFEREPGARQCLLRGGNRP